MKIHRIEIYFSNRNRCGIYSESARLRNIRIRFFPLFLLEKVVVLMNELISYDVKPHHTLIKVDETSYR